MSYYNKLSQAQEERLAMLAEEAAEIVQAVTKILRHGYESHHPDTPDLTNRRHLAYEVGNFSRVANLCFDAGDWELVDERRGYEAKDKNMKRFTHHQGLDRA